jgi:hypothetical protein
MVGIDSPAGPREGIARAPSGPRIQERVREGAGNMKGIGRMSFLVVVGLALGAVAPAARRRRRRRLW